LQLQARARRSNDDDRIDGPTDGPIGLHALIALECAESNRTSGPVGSYLTT
jgi:hypothetical protein